MNKIDAEKAIFKYPLTDIWNKCQWYSYFMIYDSVRCIWICGYKDFEDDQILFRRFDGNCSYLIDGTVAHLEGKGYSLRELKNLLI